MKSVIISPFGAKTDSLPGGTHYIRNGIKLEPLSDELKARVVEYLDSIGRDDLSKKVRQRPIYSVPCGDIAVPGRKSTEPSILDVTLDMHRLAIGLFCNAHLPMAAFFFDGIKIDGHSFDMMDVLSAPAQELEISADAWESHVTYLDFLYGSIGKSPLAELCMGRLCRAMKFGPVSDGIIDLAIALECLVGAQTEIKFQFSLNHALTNEDDPEKRMTIFRTLQGLYDVRSKVVHGGPASKSDRDKHKSVQDSWSDLVSVCQNSLTYYLSLRIPAVVDITSQDSAHHAVMFVDDDAISKHGGVCISRVDGNHRLHLAGGQEEESDPINREVSFCMATSLSLDEEIKLFRDINNNQRKMDTSHLDKIELRLSGEDLVKSRNPALFIANRLANDPDSVLTKFVYQGGKRPAGTFIPLRTLHTGLDYMLSRQNKLTALGGADAQLVVIKNYFDALQAWVPDAWENPKDYLLLRGAGLWGSCFLGAEVIDRALSKSKFDAASMLEILNSGKSWNWTRTGQFQGLSGRGGAVKIADMIAREFRDDQGVSMKELLSKILNR